MVIIHKRKRKSDKTCSLMPDVPKRTKVHAQRKFAQGLNVSPVLTPTEEIETQEKIKPDPSLEQEELLPMIRPHTEDFLTFLCFRGTSMLPTNLNFFNSAPVHSRLHVPPVRTEKINSHSPIVNLPKTTGNNERPFIAFGVRKRADPVLVSKHIDKKRRHALALQALRRKYQEQKMAKIRAVTISKLSDKSISTKTVVPTRFINKTESPLHKKSPLKVISSKVITNNSVKIKAGLQSQLKLKTSIKSQVKKKMCLRSFRGRFVQHELSLRKVRKRRPSIINVESKQSNLIERRLTSEFSSDDDQPLAKTTRSSTKLCSPKAVKDTSPNNKKSTDIRLTRTTQLAHSSVRDKIVKCKIPMVPLQTPFVKLAHSKHMANKIKCTSNLKKLQTVNGVLSSRQQKPSLKENIKKPGTPKTSTPKKANITSDHNLRKKDEKIQNVRQDIKENVKNAHGLRRTCEVALEKQKTEKIINKSNRALRQSISIETIPKVKQVTKKMNATIRSKFSTISLKAKINSSKITEKRHSATDIVPFNNHSDKSNQNNDRNLRSSKRIDVEEKTDTSTDSKKMNEICEVVLEKYKVEETSKCNKDLKSKKSEVSEIIEEQNRNLRGRSFKSEESLELNKNLNESPKSNSKCFKTIKKLSKIPAVISKKTKKKNVFTKSDVLKLQGKLRQLPVSERTLRILNKRIKEQNNSMIKRRSRRLVSQVSQNFSAVSKRLFIRKKQKGVVRNSSCKIPLISNVGSSVDYQLRNRANRSTNLRVKETSNIGNKSKVIKERNKLSAIKNNLKLAVRKCKTEIGDIKINESAKCLKPESPLSNLELSLKNVSLELKENNNKGKFSNEDVKDVIHSGKPEKTEICDTLKSNLKDSCGTIIFKQESQSLIEIAQQKSDGNKKSYHKPLEIKVHKSKIEDNIDLCKVEQKLKVESNDDHNKIMVIEENLHNTLNKILESVTSHNQNIMGSNGSLEKKLIENKQAKHNELIHLDIQNTHRNLGTANQKFISKSIQRVNKNSSASKKVSDITDQKKNVQKSFRKSIFYRKTDKRKTKLNEYDSKVKTTNRNGRTSCEEKTCDELDISVNEHDSDKIKSDKKSCGDSQLWGKGICDSQAVIEKLAEKFNKTAKISDDEPLAKLKNNVQAVKLNSKVRNVPTDDNSNAHQKGTKLEKVDIDSESCNSKAEKVDAVSGSCISRKDKISNNRNLEGKIEINFITDIINKGDERSKLPSETPNKIEFPECINSNEALNKINVSSRELGIKEDIKFSTTADCDQARAKNATFKNLNTEKSQIDSVILGNLQITEDDQKKNVDYHHSEVKSNAQEIKHKKINNDENMKQLKTYSNESDQEQKTITDNTTELGNKVSNDLVLSNPVKILSESSENKTKQSQTKENNMQSLNQPKYIVTSENIECGKTSSPVKESENCIERGELLTGAKINKSNESRPKKYTKRALKTVIKDEPRMQRPSRKTKEAAAIYMEILGHKLVGDNIDDDDISIDSFPELPNVRKMEQRENELKAKAQCINNKSDVVSESSNKKKNQKFIVTQETIENYHTNKKLEEISRYRKATNECLQKSENSIVQVNTLTSNVLTNSKSEKSESVGIAKRPMRSAAQTKPFIDFSFSDSEDSFYNEKYVTTSKTLKTKSTRNKIYEKSKLAASRKISESRGGSDRSVQNNKSAGENKKSSATKLSIKSSNHSTVLKQEEKLCTDLHSFSESDEEPLSKLAQKKFKSDEISKLAPVSVEHKESLQDNAKKMYATKAIEESTTITVDNQTVVVVEIRPHIEIRENRPLLGTTGKPKRECTKIPQNYLPLPSSSDEDMPLYQVEKIKNIKPVKTADLLCKDLDKRFGKGKVNMSTEQIEKWLNESVLAGEIGCKENDDILKYTEPSSSLNLEIKKVDEMQIIKEPSTGASCKSMETSENNDCVKPEIQIHNFNLLSKFCERKTIFKKERKLSMPNTNAFSANNESSVYAFEADNEDSVSTPFRRPSRRPSSTATSKSEDSYKYEEFKTSGHFRVPIILKPDFIKSIVKHEVVVPSGALDDQESGGVHTSESVKQGITKKLSSKDLNILHNPVGAKCISNSKSSERNSLMNPPSTTFQRTRSIDSKSYLRAKTFDRLSDNSEDFKYKIPSSPSASSSSSTIKVTKKVTVTKTRVRPIEICSPVLANDFPPNQSPALVFEAPLFYPNEKEFQDPLEYIEKIRSQAEKFGICRIAPPSTFKPECKVSDEMRFTAYNQYVHKMLHRWGPNFKEFMAISNYLKTQNITISHLPWIGGVEIDLPRLYQTVQSLGGLKEVIEKKKWPKVAELMRIPKCAQDRLTKLDDIYCKYLLPYDTLSPDEKEKLYDEVETNWAKRESRALHRSQQNSTYCDPISNSADSDSDNEIEECIVKGRSMALNGFYRIARNTMSMWFKTADPSPEEVEQEFWKHVTNKQNHICVHSGSIDSGNYGYGFAVSKNSPFARHAWNLKVLTNNTGSVLRSLGPVMGVTVPTIHVGMVFSACCWYRDPHSLPWIEYLHTGGSKIWYGIPDSMGNAFHSALLKLVPNYCRNKSIWLPSDTVMVPPSLLVENGVSISKAVQEPGQFIVVFPKAFTSCICTGYVVSESVYFAPMSWLGTAYKIFEELQNSCEPSMFSLEKLLVSVASDTRTSIDVMRQIMSFIQLLIEKEDSDIQQLQELGLTDKEKLPIPEIAVKKKKRFQEDNGSYECELCCKNLFISWVSQEDDTAIYCLTHAKACHESKKIELKNCKLYYTYNKEDLLALIEKLKVNIEAKLQKKIIGKSMVVTHW